MDKRHLPVFQVKENMDSATVRKKHAEYIMPCTINYYAESVVLRRGEGMYVEDADGKRYLDFFGGILTVSLGHCHPEVVAAVTEQLHTLGHTSTLYPNEWIVRLAEKIAELTPGNLKKTFFTSSGTEADETAVLYVSPLRALSNDVQKNLEIPLCELAEMDPKLPRSTPS